MNDRNDPVAAQIGRRLRDRRLALGLSQVDLARRLGVTYQQVQKYERGANRIAADRLQDLARILDVPIPFFYGSAVAPPGLAEAADGFLFDGMPVDGGRDEEGELLETFRRIRDARVRRRLFALMEALAGPAPRGADRGG